MQQGGRSVAYFEGAWIDGKTPIMTANTHGAWLGSMVFDGGRAVLYGNVHEGVLQATIEQLLAGDDAGASRC